ncbi:MAG: hypothetical protein M3O50_00970 [Myxococcota bacterium]|nr:hypothetical protein [Myxococcota bacterium]
MASETGGPIASCGRAVVCDDFESYAIGAPPSAPWSVAKSVGSAVVDGTRSRSGKQSVKISAPAATGYRSTLLRLTGGGLLPVTGSSVYGRMMFWLESAPTTSVHWTFIDGAGLVPGAAYHSVYRYGGQKPLPASDGGAAGNQMMASYDTPDSYAGTGPGSDCYKHSSGRAVPVAAWTCAEWQFDGATNTMRFWINGTEAADLTVSGTGEGCTQQPSTYVWTAPSFQQLDVGWESYQADDARTIWIDDLAYGQARVGCPGGD